MGQQGINVVLNDGLMSAYYSFNIIVVAGPVLRQPLNFSS